MMPYLLFANFNSSGNTSEGYIISIILLNSVKVILGTIVSGFTCSVNNYTLTIHSNIDWNIPVIIIGRTQIIN
jgi:hypothetical protein